MRFTPKSQLQGQEQRLGRFRVYIGLSQAAFARANRRDAACQNDENDLKDESTVGRWENITVA